jgi:hypothetical protein
MSAVAATSTPVPVITARYTSATAFPRPMPRRRSVAATAGATRKVRSQAMNTMRRIELKPAATARSRSATAKPKNSTPRA